MIMKITKYFFLLFICLSSCKGQNSCNLSKKSLYSITYEDALSLNKHIIPCLIDSIDASGTSFIGFKNPISSYIGNYHLNQKGIRYAYLVDYILSKDSIETVNKTWNEGEDLLHWTELTKPYRIYNIGIIVKQDKNGKPLLDALNHNDMVIIKSLYEKWWKENKSKSIELLRKEWKEKGSILRNSEYMWI